MQYLLRKFMKLHPAMDEYKWWTDIITVNINFLTALTLVLIKKIKDLFQYIRTVDKQQTNVFAVRYETDLWKTRFVYCYILWSDLHQCYRNTVGSRNISSLHISESSGRKTTFYSKCNKTSTVYLYLASFTDNKAGDYNSLWSVSLETNWTKLDLNYPCTILGQQNECNQRVHCDELQACFHFLLLLYVFYFPSFVFCCILSISYNTIYKERSLD